MNKHFEDTLRGKRMQPLFYEPSTRTRISFDAAAQDLGMTVRPFGDMGDASSTTKGETLEDTIRTVDGYNTDVIVLRHFDDDAAHRTAKIVHNARIINAGSGKAHHPTQSLLDMYTLREVKGKIDGLEIAIAGDLKYGRTTHSLIEALTTYYKGVKVFGVPAKGLELPDEYKEFLAKHGVQYNEVENFEDLSKHVDAIYMTRVQKERIEPQKLKTFDLNNYVLDAKKLGHFSNDTFIMHPLPRNHELCESIDGDPRSVAFNQAHNGYHVRKAILHELLTQ